MTQLATYADGKVTVSALVWDRILDALGDNSVAWEGEEHSVKSEHRELIDELESLDHYLAAHGCAKSDTLPELALPLPVHAALERAESFISGFEGDELQEGVEELLAELRALTTGEPSDEEPQLARPPIPGEGEPEPPLEELLDRAEQRLSTQGR